MIEILPSPNAKAISLKFPSSPDLDGYAKIVMTHSYSSPELNAAAIGRYSWLAESFCEAAARDMAHVDLVRHVGFDVLTLVRRLPWKPDDAQKAAIFLQEYLEAGHPVIDRQEIEKHLAARPKFDPGEDAYLQTISKVFRNALNEKLEEDGGAIEITGVNVDQASGEIKINTLMLGSCSQCGGESKTLDLAKQMLEYTFDSLREKHPDNQLLQKVHVGQFVKEEAKQGFIMRG